MPLQPFILNTKPFSASGLIWFANIANFTKRALSIQPKILEILVGTSNWIDHFGLVWPEYLGPLVVHFDWSGHFGRSNQKVSLTKLLSPVPLFCFLLTRTITKRMVAWVGSVQPECTTPLGTWNFRNFKPDFSHSHFQFLCQSRISNVEVSGWLTTYPSPKSKFFPKKWVSVNCDLGEGWVVSYTATSVYAWIQCDKGLVLEALASQSPMVANILFQLNTFPFSLKRLNSHRLFSKPPNIKQTPGCLRWSLFLIWSVVTLLTSLVLSLSGITRTDNLCWFYYLLRNQKWSKH